MSDGDKDALAAVLVVEKPLLAVAFAALFLATSAYLWRPKITSSGSVLVPLHDPDADEPKQSSDSAADSERPKNPRTKERRRRGKDPLKDLLKNEKKYKAFVKVTKTSSALDSALPLDAFAPSSSLCVSAGLTHTEDDGAAQEPSPAGLAVSGSDALEPSPPPPDQPCDSPATQSQLSSTPLPSESSSTPTGTPAMPASVSRSSEELPPSNAISRSPRRVPGADSTVVVNGFHASRHAPTPRRAPSPPSSTNTPPPSVAVQTQLASLRGALEAARQREAQMKSDLEKYAKELEFMRWESNTWRRRELEVPLFLRLTFIVLTWSSCKIRSTIYHTNYRPSLPPSPRCLLVRHRWSLPHCRKMEKLHQAAALPRLVLQVLPRMGTTSPCHPKLHPKLNRHLFISSHRRQDCFLPSL